MGSIGNAFEGFLIIMGIALGVIGLVFALALLGTGIGTLVGWIVSISPLRPFVEQGFEAFGIPATGLLPHIGATLGFVGGLLKGLITVKYEKKKD